MDRERTALISGGSRGIGRSVADRLAKAGYRVGLLGRTEATLDRAVQEITATGGTAEAAAADVTDFAALRAAVDGLETTLGPTDLLIDNAGTVDAAEVPAWRTDPDDWWRVLEVNLRGAYHLIRAVVPGMIEREHGRIVNVTGMIERDAPDYSAYASSKFGLARLSQNLAGPAAEHGVFVFDVSPGTIRTDLTASMPMLADADFASLDRFLAYVLAIGDGRLDHLTGRYFHAQHDDLDVILAASPADANAHRITSIRVQPSPPTR